MGFKAHGRIKNGQLSTSSRLQVIFTVQFVCYFPPISVLSSSIHPPLFLPIIQPMSTFFVLLITLLDFLIVPSFLLYTTLNNAPISIFNIILTRNHAGHAQLSVVLSQYCRSVFSKANRCRDHRITDGLR